MRTYINIRHFNNLLVYASLVLSQLTIACLMTYIANTLNIKYMAWIALILWASTVWVYVYGLAKGSRVKIILYLFSPAVSLLFYIFMDVVLHGYWMNEN